MLATEEASAAGNVAFKDIMIIEKKMAWLMVCPQFCRVERIPDAAPLCSAGQEFMTEAMFGDMNIPLPSPMISRIKANGKYSKLAGKSVNTKKTIPVIIIPAVASTLAPCLSESQPLSGPVMAMPIDIGIMNIPAQNGASSYVYPCRGSHIP